MPLEKRFLHPQVREYIPRGFRLYAGIAGGLFAAVTFYLFFSCMGEVLRLLSLDDFNNVIILTEREENFFSFFYAVISLIFGQSVCIKLWLDRPRFAAGRNMFTPVINDQRFLNMGFFLWFTRLASLYPIFFFLYGNGATVEFLDNYLSLFVFILVVLFMQQWVWIGRIFRKKALKWQAVSLLFLMAAGYGLSKFNPIDTSGINRDILSKNMYYSYRVDPPVVSHENVARVSLNCNRIFMVNHRDWPVNDSVYIVIEHDYYIYPSVRSEPPVDLPETFLILHEDEFHGIFSGRRGEGLNLYLEYRDCLLVPNSNIEMGKVNEFRKLLFQNGIDNIFNGVWTTRRNGKGMEVANVRDIYEPAFVHLRSFYLPDNNEIQEWLNEIPNIIEVFHYEDSITLNGITVTSDKFVDEVRRLILYDPEQYVIVQRVGDRTLYRDYIRVRADITSAVRQIRHALGYTMEPWENPVKTMIVELPSEEDDKINYTITYPLP